MRRLLLPVALSALTVVAIPATAHADTNRIAINTGHGWTHDANAPVLDTSRIAPGWSAAYPMQVRNDTGAAATLSISSANLVDLENGCNHAEAAVDSTCGPDEGELGHELSFSVFVDPQDNGDFESQPRWTGTLYDITSPAVLATGMPSGAVWGLRITAELPMSSGNETQTDSVDFDLRLGMQSDGVTDTVDVLGTKVTRHPGQGLLGMTTGLPFTGSGIQELTAVALWLLVAGGMALFLARVRRG